MMAHTCYKEAIGHMMALSVTSPHLMPERMNRFTGFSPHKQGLSTTIAFRMMLEAGGHRRLRPLFFHVCKQNWTPWAAVSLLHLLAQERKFCVLL